MRVVVQNSQLPTRPIDCFNELSMGAPLCRVIVDDRTIVDGCDDQLEKIARRSRAAFLRRESQINIAASSRLAVKLKVASAA